MTLKTMRSRILLAVVTVAVLFCTAWIHADESKKVKWEYKYKEISSGSPGSTSFEDMMAQAGSDGWELVSVDREQPGGLLHLYFKRAK